MGRISTQNMSSLKPRLQTELETAGLLEKLYRKGGKWVRDMAILKCVGQNPTNYLGNQYFLSKQIENAPVVVLGMYAMELKRRQSKKRGDDSSQRLLEVLPPSEFLALKFKKPYEALAEKTMAKIAKKLKTDNMKVAKRHMKHYVHLYRISNQFAVP